MLIKSQTSRDTFNRQTFDVIRKETRQVNKQKKLGKRDSLFNLLIKKWKKRKLEKQSRSHINFHKVLEIQLLKKSNDKFV